MRPAPCPVPMVKNVRGLEQLARARGGEFRFPRPGAHQAEQPDHRGGAALRARLRFGSAFRDRLCGPEPRTGSRRAGARLRCRARAHAHGPSAAASVARRTLPERIGADLILIGTVARSGLMGTVVGNTAERILDETRSDVLVLN
ncbi:MAG: universal stress protein [Gammaproteobacteria bacterium]|nr:universal stress protein [Gammaproteobacteria bacterium]